LRAARGHHRPGVSEVTVELPQTLRENLVEELDNYLEAIGTPDGEQVASYVIELLEGAADEHDLDDVILNLEEEGELDDSLATVLEEEMESNDEFDDFDDEEEEEAEEED
jgi:predicted AlkP superfamily phosphohydrolase/phosphomutase